MKTVCTNKEFNQALLDHEPKILCKGEAAKPFLYKQKLKRGIIAAGIVTGIIGVATSPFSKALFTVGPFRTNFGFSIETITMAELAILLGLVILFIGLSMGKHVKVITDGGDSSVEFEPQYK